MNFKIPRILSGNTLKIVAAISMFIDHFGFMFFPKLLNGRSSMTTSRLLPALILSRKSSFPSRIMLTRIFCPFIAERILALPLSELTTTASNVDIPP